MTPVTAVLIPEAEAALAALAERTGLSRTDLLNRAVQLYDAIDAETAAGSQVLIRREDGTLKALELR